MLTLIAFIVALGVLITVHEYGHYRVALACGVKVLRFSIGFGKVLLRWKVKGSATEFVLCALPLGGYVKMLDEREAPVVLAERHLAFNNQALRKRVAIVAAGPIANLLLATLLYSIVNWSGMDVPKAVLASPSLGSIAEKSGLKGGEWVKLGGLQGDELKAIASFDDVRWLLTQGTLQGRDVHFGYETPSQKSATVVLELGALHAIDVDADLFSKIGLLSPFSPAVIGKVRHGGAAQTAGLLEGDQVLKVGTIEIVDAQQLRELIRYSAMQGSPEPQTWEIQRQLQRIRLEVKLQTEQVGDYLIGRIHAYVGLAPELVSLRYGFFEGLGLGLVRTWDVSALSLSMVGKMVLGQASLKNLSGPLSIADYAGKSASMGLNHYLLFLALISVSLGILNLLPLPVLDGGHLMYYLWEGLTGRKVPEVWLERFQKLGVTLLLLMMVIAIFNDLTRLSALFF